MKKKIVCLGELVIMICCEIEILNKVFLLLYSWIKIENLVLFVK